MYTSLNFTISYTVTFDFCFLDNLSEVTQSRLDWVPKSEYLGIVAAGHVTGQLTFLFFFLFFSTSLIRTTQTFYCCTLQIIRSNLVGMPYV